MPSREKGEDNFGEAYVKEAEPVEIPSPALDLLDNGRGGGVLNRSQQSRSLPAWLEDIVVEREIDQSLTGSQDNHTQLRRINIMAQRQLEQPSINIQDMWHLMTMRKGEKNGEGLDISWVAATTKQ